MKDFLLTSWNRLYFDLVSGPAYFLWKENRPGVWARITRRIEE